MKSKITLTLLMMLTCFSIHTNAQKSKAEYSAILNTSIDECFPHAAAQIIYGYKIPLEEFNYANGRMLSSWFIYYRGLLKYRCKFLMTIDQQNTFDIETIDIQMESSSDGKWLSSTKSALSKKEDKIRTAFIDGIRKALKNENMCKQNKDWFFKDPYINKLFFEKATDLAADRWFEAHLKNQNVKWELTFTNVEKYTGKNNNYSYIEHYSHNPENPLSSNELMGNFYISKYTDSDKNVLTPKNKKLKVEGYCRSLKYHTGNFYITLTNKLEDKLPDSPTAKNASKKKKSVLDVAEDLKKLKELLDLGAITKEEYETEKDKLLNGK
jgi:hypothetical protein